MDKKHLIKIAKVIALLYVASFLVVNWNDVSWIFNYREVSGMVDDFFNPYPGVDASDLEPYFLPNHSQHAREPINEVKTTYTDKQNTLEIPKISISVPIVFSQNTSEKSILKDLDSGVVYYPGSVLPGQKGQIAILGHSAPPGWPKIKYYWAFSELNSLQEGDNIYIDLNNRQYTYTVKKKFFINKGADIPADNLTADKNVLILISCYPPGKDDKRIVIQAELELTF